MRIAAKAARIGDKILNIVILMLAVIFFLCGTYALWDNYKILQGGSVDAKIMSYKPDPADPSNPSLSDLQAINPDVRAWITIDNTHIDYPVVQGENDSEYLNKDIDGQFALAGSVFLDYRNAADFSDFYNIIYGHHMSSGAMFGDIENFREEGYFDTHTTGSLCTPGETYRISLFACIVADGYDSWIYSLDYSGEESESQLLAYITEKSVQKRDPEFSDIRRIIALSTCTDTSTNERTVLLGTLIPVSESPSATS
ncbi:MAG TPA: class B sortase [Lachnospiraceae bacterium]|nr:class B sortase [Lachnospiraceae bacterium]